MRAPFAEGLHEAADVADVEVTDAPVDPDPGIILLVAGGPAHAFSMSRSNTRADAIARGARQGTEKFGLREWMDALPSGRHPERLATFDTRMSKVFVAFYFRFFKRA